MCRVMKVCRAPVVSTAFVTSQSKSRILSVLSVRASPSRSPRCAFGHETLEMADRANRSTAVTEKDFVGPPSVQKVDALIDFIDQRESHGEVAK